MPDAFFSSTAKKRKRPSQIPTSSNKVARTSKHRGSASKKIPHQQKAARRDEELDSDATHSGIDALSLRASDIDHLESDREEDVHETSAEKRLRLANVYLQSVKEGLSLGESVQDNYMYCAHDGLHI